MPHHYGTALHRQDGIDKAPVKRLFCGQNVILAQEGMKVFISFSNRAYAPEQKFMSVGPGLLEIRYHLVVQEQLKRICIHERSDRNRIRLSIVMEEILRFGSPNANVTGLKNEGCGRVCSAGYHSYYRLIAFLDSLAYLLGAQEATALRIYLQGNHRIGA
ncbi:MAG: hypothetical protein JWN89_97 [Parcubacteria group bacterium]|nr:hypothetical protein [Parcubacteria group bacterium]